MTGMVFTGPAGRNREAFYYRDIGMGFGKCAANVVSAIFRFVVINNNLVVFVVLLQDGGQQDHDVFFLVTSGDENRHQVVIMPVYPGKFGVGNKVEKRNRKAQNDEK